MTIEETIVRLLAALALGALIGLERQWRQRMAGLRTNTLVSLGAGGFTVFSLLVPEDVSPTRVAAQVVSGIGFLGAGVILRTGANIQGLNTAATLWCAAGVGVLSGAGYLSEALVLAVLILLTNVLLRPVMRAINRQPLVSTEVDHRYLIRVVGRADQEAHIRGLLLQGVNTSGLRLQSLESEDLPEAGKVEVFARLVSSEQSETALEQAVGRLSLVPSVTGASWELLDEQGRDAEGNGGLFART